MGFWLLCISCKSMRKKGIYGRKMLKWSSQKVQNTTFLLTSHGVSSLTVQYVCVYSITGN